MANVGNPITLLPSVLDRLLDDRPEEKLRDPPDSRFDIGKLKDAVARDLEALLNTRRERFADPPSEFAEVNRSLVMYGLPDFTSYSLVSQGDKNRMRRTLEQAIVRFEPRLTRVRVAVEETRAVDRDLRFRIEALLMAEPAPEPVFFDAMLRLNTREYVVQGHH